MMLERVFFHDVMNLAGGIAGLLELMRSAENGDIEHLIDMSSGNIHDLMEEVSVQRDLHAAEVNELRCSCDVISSVHTLIQMVSVYQAHPVCDKRILKLSEHCEIFDLSSDPVLLKRILGNLIKNAAEASEIGQSVTVACWKEGDSAIFTVHNITVMPMDIRHQVFHRSFSTKGADRGLGTYSVKLFTEKYLHGVVSFDSEDGVGTTFKVVLPIQGHKITR